MVRFVTFILINFFCATQVFSQVEAIHAKKFKTLVIADAMVVDGLGTPASGPKDIIIENNRITSIRQGNERSEHRKNADRVIDANGRYVLPGFINMHAHIMYNRAGIPMDQPYQYYLWLASGITTVRDVGSDFAKTSVDREKSARNAIIAPRIFLYRGTWGHYPEDEVRKRLRRFKKEGADGLKFGTMDRRTFDAASDEANKLGLRVANHVGVEDMNAWDNIRMKTTSIEHWYGVPDAAIKDRIQHFPADMNIANEYHRFRWAGRLWRESDPQILDSLLKSMVEAGVAWDVTFCIYEASRDIQRAVSSPWYKDYLHPGLEKFFKPSPTSHGSFFRDWTHTDEVYWRENYQIWFKAARRFAQLGGIITTGEDAGFIYQIFGFGYLRELQLHEEAGFHPLQVVQHATSNSAKVLGMGDKIGQINKGFLADLVIVNGNPLADLRILMPRDIKSLTERPGGIEWTIKDGIPYHAPTMLKAVREMVQKSREDNKIGYLVD